MTESTAIIKAEVAKIKESAEILVQTIEVETDKAKVQLEAAQPALDEAAAALNVILFNLFTCQPFSKSFLHFSNADNYNSGYGDGAKIRKTAIFDYLDHGRVFDFVPTENKAGES